MDTRQQDSDGKPPLTVFKGEVKVHCRGVTPTEAFDLVLKFSGLRDRRNLCEEVAPEYRRRGHIQIIDREGLEQYTCDCYGIIKEEFNLLVGGDFRVPAQTYLRPNISTRRN